MTKIKFDSKNYRKHGDENKRLIRKSLEECGAGRSVVIDSDGELIAGNGVYEQAQKLGMKVREVETDGSELVVVKRTDLRRDDEKRKLLAKADNATSDTSEWDVEALREDWSDDDLKAWGIDIPEIESKEQTEAVEDDFDEETDEVEAQVKRGEVYQLGNHRLMCGDSTSAEDVEKLMGGGKADLVITDPPYNVAIGSKNKALNTVQKAGRCTKDIAGDKGMTDEECGEKLWFPAFANLLANSYDDTPIYVTMPQGGTHMMMMMMMMKAGWQVKHELIWLKNAPTFSLGRLNYDYKHEPILYGWNKTHRWYGNGKCKTSILEFDKPRKCDLHPTMKPVALFVEMMLNSSKRGDIVLDAFGGSGTTIISAEECGRCARVMEFDPHYCDVIIARWEKLTGKKATKIN